MSGDLTVVGRAARALHDAALDRVWLDALPSDASIESRSDGYAVQAAVARLTGQATVGWKIAATSAAGQQHIHVPGPLAGRVFADRVVSDGSVVSLDGNTMNVAELELVFVMGASVTPQSNPFEEGEVLRRVGGLRLGVEFPSTRFNDATAVGQYQLIADNACAHEFLLGPSAADTWRDLDLSTVGVVADVHGPSGSRRCKGVGSNVLGNPVTALTWLVNELSSHDLGLEAGQFVTTGTCCVPIPVTPGDTLDARFDGLGDVRCSFVA